LSPEEDQLVISDCGLSSLTQSVDAPNRQRQAKGESELPLIAQSVTGHALQAATNKKKRPPLDEKYGSKHKMSKNVSTQ